MEESLLCSLMVRDRPAGNRVEPVTNDTERYRNIFDELFLTMEMELVRLAVASPGFTVTFQTAYEHFHANRTEKSFIRRHLRSSIFFQMEQCNIFFLKPEYVRIYL